MKKELSPSHNFHFSSFVKNKQSAKSYQFFLFILRTRNKNVTKYIFTAFPLPQAVDVGHLFAQSGTSYRSKSLPLTNLSPKLLLSDSCLTYCYRTLKSLVSG